MNTLYLVLSYPWVGLVIASIVELIGWSIVRLARIREKSPLRFLRFAGYAVYLLAALLAIGSLRAIFQIRKAEAAHPPMGRLVDVGGYRLHILAEGEAKGGPTLVWIPGGHAQGLSMYHLHKAMRGETRSILYDRPGTGWSDRGPLPTSTRREAEELKTLLDNAGEKGPFILLGHSYGGLLAANFARRYPTQLSALVLLDPTPPDVLIYMPDGSGPNIPGALVRGSQITGLMKLFGLWSDPSETVAKREDDIGKLYRTIQERLADVKGPLQSRSARVDGDWVSASLFNEWFDPKLLSELVVYDGELGDLPVYLITPEGDTKEAEIKQMGIRDEEIPRAMNFLKRARKRYLAISSKSEFIAAPAGTGHNYPYEVPDFVVEQARKVLASNRAAVPAP